MLPSRAPDVAAQLAVEAPPPLKQTPSNSARARLTLFIIRDIGSGLEIVGNASAVCGNTDFTATPGQLLLPATLKDAMCYALFLSTISVSEFVVVTGLARTPACWPVYCLGRMRRTVVMVHDSCWRSRGASGYGLLFLRAPPEPCPHCSPEG